MAPVGHATTLVQPRTHCSVEIGRQVQRGRDNHRSGSHLHTSEAGESVQWQRVRESLRKCKLERAWRCKNRETCASLQGAVCLARGRNERSLLLFDRVYPWCSLLPVRFFASCSVSPPSSSFLRLLSSPFRPRFPLPFPLAASTIPENMLGTGIGSLARPLIQGTLSCLASGETFPPSRRSGRVLFIFSFIFPVFFFSSSLPRKNERPYENRETRKIFFLRAEFRLYPRTETRVNLGTRLPVEASTLSAGKSVGPILIPRIATKWSTEQWPRHCGKDVSVRKLGRWDRTVVFARTP